MLPLQPDWQQVLRATSTELRLPPPCPDGDWAEREFGHIEVADGRLRERLLTVARDFMAQPQAPIPVACGGSAAKLKGAYRLLAHPMLSLDTLLKPHIEATAARMAEHPIVLAVQDTTSLNYSTHRRTEGLGPINTRADGAQGLKLHDTLAFTPEGRVLGILDAECWAREDTAAGTKSPRGEGEEWQALHAFIHRTPVLPDTPPRLGTAMGMVAKIGGFLGRKHDGAPGATVIWRGLHRLSFLTETFRNLPDLPSRR